MATKLTLSVDKDTIQLAKDLAAENNVSVSKFFRKIIKDFPRKEKKKDPLIEKYKDIEIPQWIKDLSVTTKGDVPENVNYDELRYEYLKERYGL